jgi:mycothiol synthase
MRAVDITDPPDETQRSAIAGLVESVHGLIGERPVSDQTWLELTRTGASRLLAVIVRATPTMSEPESGGPPPTPELEGAALVVPSSDGGMLEVVVGDRSDRRDAVFADLAETAIDTWRRRRGGHLTWWVDDAGAAIAVAQTVGLAPTRALHEMRRALPLPERASVPSRAFRPLIDDAGWLAVNNRAFANHGEQGGWTLDTLQLRFAEPWFSADGFRIITADQADLADAPSGQTDRQTDRHAGDVSDVNEGETIVAFCWTKIHHDHVPPLGEIYVIGVDPSRHGSGLGKQATLAGLDWLTDAGITEAMLYVDADNVAAVAMYARLGFAIYRTRTAFTGTLEPPDVLVQH